MKQAEKIYMISDAAKRVEVEAHVLRYWEEELEVPAKRNEMGHRYYTEEDIRRFIRIKELKEQGLQLKAIRHMLKSGDLQTPVLLFEKASGTEAAGGQAGQEEKQAEGEMGKRHVLMVKKGEFLPVDEKAVAAQEESREQKSFRLQQLLKDMIAEAVQCNNQEICQEIKDTLLKELDYQFRLQEERDDARDEERMKRQEEHYQQVDELIRAYAQKGRKGKKVRRDKARREREKAAKEKAAKETEAELEEELEEGLEEESEEKSGPAKEQEAEAEKELGEKQEEDAKEEEKKKGKGFGKGFLLRKKRSVV